MSVIKKKSSHIAAIVLNDESVSANRRIFDTFKRNGSLGSGHGQGGRKVRVVDQFCVRQSMFVVFLFQGKVSKVERLGGGGVDVKLGDLGKIEADLE